MFRDFGEPGPSSGAGGAYGGPAQPPATGQQVRATRRLERCGPPRPGPGRSGTDRVWGPWPRVLPTFRRPRALAPTAQGNARRGRDRDLRMSPLSLTPFPLPVRLSLPGTFLSYCPPLISLSHLRSKGAPGHLRSSWPRQDRGA